MTDRAGQDGADREGPGEQSWSSAAEPEATDPIDLNKLAQDWIALWQSELSAMAADREIQETWQATMGVWAGVATAVMNATIRPARQRGPSAQDGDDGGDFGGRRARTKSAPGAKATAAAPDPRDAEIERLGRHIAALEARLEELERSGGPRRTAKRKR